MTRLSPLVGDRRRLRASTRLRPQNRDLVSDQVWVAPPPGIIRDLEREQESVFPFLSTFDSVDQTWLAE